MLVPYYYPIGQDFTEYKIPETYLSVWYEGATLSLLQFRCFA